MLIRPRVIPALLLSDGGMVKTVQFDDARYLGDPINILKIFNDKEVDEVVLLDIDATVARRSPDLNLLSRIASECFMPLAYGGGGVRDLRTAREVLALGIEKVVINTHAVERPSFVAEVADAVGSQSVVASIDAKKTFLGRYRVRTRGGRRRTGKTPVEVAERLVDQGAGEVLLTSIDRDGVMKGYDLDLVRDVAHAVDVPVVACGGAGSLSDFVEAVEAGASAVAAGSIFAYQGAHRAVLVSYPSQAQLMELFGVQELPSESRLENGFGFHAGSN